MCRFGKSGCQFCSACEGIVCCILDVRERFQCCVGFDDCQAVGFDCYDTLNSVPTLFSSRVSMLAAPLSYCSIFPLNADAFGFCVEGCELSIGGAASLLCKIAELWSLLDCVGSSGFHEPLVVSGIINHCFAGISSVSCPHVGEPNVHTDSTHIGHEYCVTGCSGSVCVQEFTLSMIHVLICSQVRMDLSCLLLVNCSATMVLHVACVVPAWLGCIAIVSVVSLMHLPLGTNFLKSVAVSTSKCL